MSVSEQVPDQLEAFVGKVLGDMSGGLAAALAGFGDVLGLWKDLDTGGPATSAELAQRTGTNERYVREWLAGVHAAGYTDYDPTTGIYSLPPHAAACFAHEGGPVFMGGSIQMMRGIHYPNSRYVGYDVFPQQIDLAIANAKAAGLDDRIRFEVLDASLGLPGDFDVITTFDVVHDAVDPAGLLRVIRDALRPGGRFLCLIGNPFNHLYEMTP